MRYPLTTRGSISLAGAVYLLVGPAQHHADLVAGIIGSTTLAITALLLLVGGLTFLKIRRNLNLNIYTSGKDLLTENPERVVVKVNSIQLPPLLESRLKIKFKHPGILSKEYILSGRQNSERTLVEDITFPHRGDWEVAGIEVSIGDIFGLTKLSYLNKTATPIIRVKPGSQYSKHIPVISSSERTGEEMEQNLVRTGDPYDLKQYHPADGVKRIIWKLFAKSGDLYSRLEEFAMTPEGKVAVFVVAAKNDDSLCNWTLNYLREMESLGLDIIVGASGLKKLGGKTLAKSFTEAEELLIQTAWTSPWGNETDSATLKQQLVEDAAQVLEGATTTDTNLSRVLIFVAGESISNQSQLDALIELGAMFEQKRIDPVFCCKESKEVKKIETPILKLFDKVIFDSASVTSESPNNDSFSKFLKVCASSQWHVII